jgi:hypothetical protein
LGDARLHPDEGSSALKYRACAQNVTDAIHSFTLKVTLGDARLHPDVGQVLSSTVPAHRM